MKRMYFPDGNEDIGEKMKKVNTKYYEIKNTHEAALAAVRHGLIDESYFEVSPNRQNTFPVLNHSTAILKPDHKGNSVIDTDV